MSNEQGESAAQAKNVHGLGPLESEVMEVVWGKGRATVGEVATLINESRPVAYTTVMTVMARLVDKGLLSREFSGKAYVYKPAKTAEEYESELARDRVRGLIRDFGDLAVVNFVAEIEASDPDRLRRLTEFLERRKNR